MTHTRIALNYRPAAVWVYDFVKGGYICSCCFKRNNEPTPYCPHCGEKIYEIEEGVNI